MYTSEILGRGGISAKVVAHSKNGYIPECPDLITMELHYPRFINSQVMTHRVFSRSASSSRAIPVPKVISAIKNNPATPIHWGKNIAGMSAQEEHTDPVRIDSFDYSPQEAWFIASQGSLSLAQAFCKAGYHKQIVNRLTEPYSFITVIVTATEWSNFFRLRLEEDAQPEIQELAQCMKAAIIASTAKVMQDNTPELNTHLPYVSSGELDKYSHSVFSLKTLRKLSVARCARGSYLNHNNTNPSVDNDVKLYDKLLEHRHMSPFEHVAMPMVDNDPETFPDGATHQDRDGNYWSGNFKQWIQYRQTL